MTKFIPLVNLFRPLFDASFQLFLIFANMMELGIAFKFFRQIIVLNCN